MKVRFIENAAGSLIRSVEEVRGLNMRGLMDKIVPLLTLATGLLAVVFACLLAGDNGLDGYSGILLGGICLFLQVLFVDVYRQRKTWDIKIGLLALLALGFIIILYVLPEYLTGLQINGVIHRSVFGILFLLATGVPVMGISLYYLMGATPSAEDISRYPVILAPVILAMSVYLVLISQLVIKGFSNLKWEIISKPYFNFTSPVKITIAGDWPKWSSALQQGIGIENHILGTGLLMVMTTLIALPIGVGAGIFLSEYAEGRFGNFTRFIITSLRSISMLILGFSAYSLVKASSGTPLAYILKGVMFDGFVWRENQGGTFFAASLVLSLLVIPIITRATEEGCRSLPNELREGSLGLGASGETTLWRIILPWSLPNIITSVLLGCAEAAGDMAILMFIAGRGDFGVGPFKQVTSLSYLVFDIWWGEKSYHLTMLPYQFTTGLILMVITVGLGVIALILKRWLVRRHRGG